MVAQCVWEDFIKRLDFLSSVASVNSWLEFDQTYYEGSKEFRDTVTRYAFEDATMGFDARACALEVIWIE